MIGCATYVPKEAQSPDDLRWMRVALSMAQEAFDHGEVPVGCVFARDGRILAQARNRTNELMNVRTSPLTQATRHAELEAIDEIVRDHPPQNPQFGRAPHQGPAEDNILLGTTLYVTIEPCLMCASALRQIGIQRVVFGAGNERFGGNGTVLPIHARWVKYSNSSDALSYNPPYESQGGYMREEAIMILRQFYMTENTKGRWLLLTQRPNPRPKRGAFSRRTFIVCMARLIPAPGVSMHGYAIESPEP